MGVSGVIRDLVFGGIYDVMMAQTYSACLGCIPVAAALLLWSVGDVAVGSWTVYYSISTFATIRGSSLIFLGIIGILTATCILRGRIKTGVGAVLFIGQCIIALYRIGMIIGWCVNCFIGTAWYPDEWEEDFNRKMLEICGHEVQQWLGLYYDPVGAVLTVILQVVFTLAGCHFIVQLSRSYFRIIDTGGSGWELECAEELLSAASSNTRFMRLMAWMKPVKKPCQASLLSGTGGGCPSAGGDGGIYRGYGAAPEDGGNVGAPQCGYGMGGRGGGGGGSAMTFGDRPIGEPPRILGEADFALDPADRPGNRLPGRGRCPSTQMGSHGVEKNREGGEVMAASLGLEELLNEMARSKMRAEEVKIQALDDDDDEWENERPRSWQNQQMVKASNAPAVSEKDLTTSANPTATSAASSPASKSRSGKSVKSFPLPPPPAPVPFDTRSTATTTSMRSASRRAPHS